MRWAEVKALGFGALLASIAVGVMVAGWQPPSLPHKYAADSRRGEITQNGKAKTPVVTAEFHGEAELSDFYKKTVEKSLIDLERTSCGLVKMTVVWDFHPSTGMLRAIMRGDNVVMSVKDESVKSAFDGDEDMLGFTQPKAKWVFLITDRIEDPETAAWVTAHEFSHAIGMDHVELGLMQPRAPEFPKPDAVWERDDLREFCKVWSCDVAMFDDCRDR